jgi:hypothetical protein
MEWLVLAMLAMVTARVARQRLRYPATRAFRRV